MSTVRRTCTSKPLAEARVASERIGPRPTRSGFGAVRTFAGHTTDDNVPTMQDEKTGRSLTPYLKDVAVGKIKLTCPYTEGED